MRRCLTITTAVIAATLALGARDDAWAQARSTLDIYVVDVEGGNATLFVAPSGQSLLIDTGNVGAAPSVRDAERIMLAAKDAGLTQIDNLIITHWHGDHFGGLSELAARIPIMCSVSAPSSLAVDLAQEFGITLVGFLRERRFNVYAHEGRVRL